MKCSIYCKLITFSYIYLSYNRSKIPWSELQNHMKKFDRIVKEEPRDGFCFVHSLRDILLHDHNQLYSLQTLKYIILNEIYENNTSYKTFYQGSIREMLHNAEQYIKNGVFCNDVVDLIVAATSKCLQLNLFIFQNVHGKIHVVNQISHPPCTRDAFLKYANEHYEPIVSDPNFSPSGLPKDQILPDLPEVIPPKVLPTLKNVVTKRPLHSGPIETQDLGSDMEEDHIPQKHPIHDKQHTTLPDFLNFQQLDSDPDYPITTSDIQTSSFTTDCIDLTSVTSEQSERNTNSQNTSSISQHPLPNQSDPGNQLPPLPIPHKRPPKYAKKKLMPGLFRDITPKQVHEIPWEINGNVIYKMKCSENNLVRDTTDGRWFHLKNSGKVGLNGIRKVGSCHGSLICTYENCPKVTTENVYNKIDFKREGQKQYTCGVCGYYAQRVYCGCFKVVEYDRDKGEVTVTHEGEHNCHPKPNYRAKQDLMDQQSIPPSSFGSALETKKVWMNYHLQHGDIHMARKIANKISDADIAARIKRLRQNPNHPLSSQDEIESFRNISSLKKEISKRYGDTYLIYKMCCEP